MIVFRREQMLLHDEVGMYRNVFSGPCLKPHEQKPKKKTVDIKQITMDI